MSKKYKNIANKTTNPVVALAILNGDSYLPTEATRRSRKIAKLAHKDRRWNVDHQELTFLSNFAAIVPAAIVGVTVGSYTPDVFGWVTLLTVQAAAMFACRKRQFILLDALNYKHVRGTAWATTDLVRHCMSMLERSDVIADSESQVVGFLNRYIEIVEENLDSDQEATLTTMLANQSSKAAAKVVREYQAVTGCATPAERADVLSGKKEKAEIEAREAEKNHALETARRKAAYKALTQQLDADGEILNDEIESSNYALTQLS